MDTKYLTPRDHIGPEHAWKTDTSGLAIPNPDVGEPAPLQAVGFQIPVPTQIETGDIINTTRRIEIKQAPSIDPNDPLGSRIIPGTRIIETNMRPVFDTLISSDIYVECDAPTSERPKNKTTVEQTLPTPSTPTNDETKAGDSE